MKLGLSLIRDIGSCPGDVVGCRGLGVGMANNFCLSFAKGDTFRYTIISLVAVNSMSG